MAHPPGSHPAGGDGGVLRRVVRRIRGLDAIEPQVHQLDARTADIRADIDSLRATLDSIRGLLTPDGPDERDLATVLRDRFDHALLHAEALDAQSRKATEQALAGLRSAVRLTQALVEQGQGNDGDRSTSSETEPSAAPAAPVRRFRHPVPSFDALYRSFEDSHRGGGDEIRDRQASDYGPLIEELVGMGLPAVDLGCGRGELVALMAGAGLDAVGVDSNLGQLPNGGAERYVQADLFDWLDDRDDESLCAVFSLHVIEHLPLELQVRLIFESRRVLAPGGALVIETPNAMSVTTAATNFWVDPTHERPVHPMLLEFLAREAGLREIEVRPLHPLDLSFRGEAQVPDLVEDLNSLLLGCGDVALVARR